MKFLFLFLLSFSVFAQPIPTGSIVRNRGTTNPYVFGYSVNGSGGLGRQIGNYLSSCSGWTCTLARTATTAPICTAQVTTVAGVWCYVTCSTSQCVSLCFNPGGGTAMYQHDVTCIGVGL